MSENGDRAEGGMDRPPRPARLVRRRRFHFCVGFLVTAAVLLIVVHFTPLSYTGTTTFERRSDAADTARGKGGADSYATLKLGLMHYLVGEEAVAKAVEGLGLTRGLSRNSEGKLTPAGKIARQKLIRKIRQEIKVDWEVKSDFLDLVSVSVTDPDPVLAQQIPNELVKNYIEDVHDKLRRRLTASLQFLMKQTDTCRTRLRELDANRLAFEAEHAPLPLDSPAALAEGIEQTEARLAGLESRKRAAEIRLWAAQRKFGCLWGNSPDLAKALTLELTSRSAAEVASRPTAVPGCELVVVGWFEPLTHPTIVPERSEAETQLELTRVNALIDAKVNWELAKGEVEDLKRAAKSVAKRLVELQALEARFAPKVLQYREMKQEIKDERVELALWEKRMTEVQATLSAEVAKRRTHLQAVQAAEEQLLPTSPRLRPLLLWTLVGSVLVGIVVSILPTMRRMISGGKAPPVKPGGRLVRVACGVLVVILLVAVAAGTFSLVLKLHHPPLYGEWQSDPLAFLWRILMEGHTRLSALFS